MKIIFVSVVSLLLAFFPLFSFAKQQILYNPSTNHWVQDSTNRTKIEILKTLNKESEEANYQMITLTPKEEAEVLAGDLTVVVKDGILVKEALVKTPTEEQKAKQELKTYVLSVFPELTGTKDLTVLIVKNSTLPPSIKGMLYKAIMDKSLE